MTIAIVNKTSAAPAASTSVNTASISRTLGRMYLIPVSSLTNTSVDPSIPTVSGAGISQLASETFLWTPSGTNRRRITLLLALAASSGSAVFAIAHATAPTRMTYIVDEADGVDPVTPYDTSKTQTVSSSSSASVLAEGMTISNSPVIPVNSRIYAINAGNTNATTMRGELDADKAGTTNSADHITLAGIGNVSSPVHKMISFWNDESVRRDLSPGYLNNDGQTYGGLSIVLNAFQPLIERAARFNRRPRGNFNNLTRY